MKHSEGGWKVSQHFDSSDIIIRQVDPLYPENDGKIIANCQDIDWREDFSYEEIEANAALIAASPIMLEQLKQIFDWKEEIEKDEPISGADLVDWFTEFYKFSEQIINKAEGRGSK